MIPLSGTAKSTSFIIRPLHRKCDLFKATWKHAFGVDAKQTKYTII